VFFSWVCPTKQPNPAALSMSWDKWPPNGLATVWQLLLSIGAVL